jgi:predicted N-acetyltransferase YhbS
MSWLDLTGWLGSALLIYSVMQARVLRFRILNLVASAILAGFNAALEIWPMVAMNVALCAINLWHIRSLVHTRHDSATYEVLEVGPQDEYLRHVLRVHEADILKYQPDFLWDGARSDRAAFLVQRGDETVGVVLVEDTGDGVAHVVLDYVTQRFRDFSPGEFVWRRSGALRDHGFRKVITPEHMVAPYYGRLGFRPLSNGSYELTL